MFCMFCMYYTAYRYLQRLQRSHRYLQLVSWLEGHMCQAEPQLCINLLAMICGYNPSNLDTARLPIYLRYTPSGTSVQNMVHWAQVGGVRRKGWGGVGGIMNRIPPNYGWMLLLMQCFCL